MRLAPPLLVWTTPRLRHGCAVVAALALTVLVVPRAATADPSAETCIKFWPEVRYGAMGYNHLVHIANRCAVAADCYVSTDVAPEPVEQEVPAKAEVLVNTFLGSPARTFTPQVKCKMRP
jgi:hypothetical protein